MENRFESFKAASEREQIAINRMMSAVSFLMPQLDVMIDEDDQKNLLITMRLDAGSVAHEGSFRISIICRDALMDIEGVYFQLGMDIIHTLYDRVHKEIVKGDGCK